MKNILPKMAGKNLPKCQMLTIFSDLLPRKNWIGQLLEILGLPLREHVKKRENLLKNQILRLHIYSLSRKVKWLKLDIQHAICHFLKLILSIYGAICLFVKLKRQLSRANCRFLSLKTHRKDAICPVLKLKLHKYSAFTRVLILKNGNHPATSVVLNLKL